MTFQSGYDLFCPDPGQEEQMFCKVCGVECQVERCEGPTSNVSAMAKSKRKHDKFTCPNSGQKWHNQVVAIYQAAEKMPSPSIREMMFEDLDEIVRKNLKLHSLMRRRIEEPKWKE